MKFDNQRSIGFNKSVNEANEEGGRAEFVSLPIIWRVIGSYIISLREVKNPLEPFSLCVLGI